MRNINQNCIAESVHNGQALRNALDNFGKMPVGTNYMTKDERAYMLLYNDEYREQECSKCCAPRWLKRYDAVVRARRLEERREAERRAAALLEAQRAEEQRAENERLEREHIKREQMELELKTAAKKISRKRFMFDEYSDACEQEYLQTESSEYKYCSEEPCSSSELTNLLPGYKNRRKTPSQCIRSIGTGFEKSSPENSL